MSTINFIQPSSTLYYFSHRKRDNFFVGRYRDIYAAVRAKPLRNHSRRPLTLPTCSPEYEPSRRGDRRKSWKARVRASESERSCRAYERKRTILLSHFSLFLSLWLPLVRDLANVLVTREVASVSVDLHLVQRAKLLRESSVRTFVRSSRSRATWQIAPPGPSSHCSPPFFFLPSPQDVTRSILVGTGACEPE